MATQRIQDLVFTLYGEYLLDRPDPVWVGALISLLQPFGVSEGAVRTGLSRMSRKGWLEARRWGRNSFYDLSPRGRGLLEEGKARIFHPTWKHEWDGEWFLLAYSIPEDVRHLRDRLRDRLAWLGFGSLGNGLWISPHDVESEVAALSDALEISKHIECFRARRIGGQETASLVAKCWDLPAVSARYREFIGRWEAELERCSLGVESGAVTGVECYVLRFDLIHEFRVFPLEDPYLPESLLPSDWAGEEATRLFHGLHDVLAGPADGYVDHVLADSPTIGSPTEAV